MRGNGIDARPALEDAKVVRRARTAVAGNALLGKESDGAREGVNGIGQAVIAPAMSAGTVDGDVETPAGQGLGGDVIGVGAVQNQKGLDAASVAGLARQVAHATEGA